ncbi:MAG: S8 family serine peptidase [Bacteroidota bacterium]
MKNVLLVLPIFLLAQCNDTDKNALIVYNGKNHPQKAKEEFTKEIVKTWPLKDLVKDTIPGISLSRAYKEFIKDKAGDSVIVALIDMPVKISHPDIRNHLWRNTGEIPNNKKDDDYNGYIDDLNGWNFLGNEKGENRVFMNYEYTRWLKKYGADFLSKASPEDSLLVKRYQMAQADYDKRYEYAVGQLKKADSIETAFKKHKDLMQSHLGKKAYTSADLDTVKKENPSDKMLLESVNFLEKMFSRNRDSAWVHNNTLQAKNRLEILLNLEGDDRKLTGDDPTDLKDSHYGNPIINHNLDLLGHETRMAGVILSTYGNPELGTLMGKIQLMPIPISGLGDEHDKDMALAIRYAVDNGAKVINISSGKYYSLYEDWVHDAIRYAEQNDVLIVASSGNKGLDLDLPDSYKYPSDVDSERNEISNNFIRVGESNYVLDSTIVHPATNYGKTQVDVFAPGEEIYTTSTKKSGYTYSSGTSAAAAMVSKLAAIIRSYYPDLDVGSLKELLLESGVAYDTPVYKKTAKGVRDIVPFNQLSKSGKVINAYNAFLTLEKMKRK